MATPDVESDLLRWLAAQPGLAAHVVASGASRNAWPSLLVPASGAGVPTDHVIVEYLTVATDHDNDSLNRWFSMLVVVHGQRTSDGKAHARACAIFDAMNGHGGHVGAWVAPVSEVAYADLRPRNIRVLSREPTTPEDKVIVAVECEVWFAG